MIELARRIFEAEEKRNKQEKLYLKALLHYHEGNYRKAAKLFSKVNTHDSIYMSILAHTKHGNKKQALYSINSYLDIVQAWPISNEKDEAIERIKEIKKLI